MTLKDRAHRLDAIASTGDVEALERALEALTARQCRQLLLATLLAVQTMEETVDDTE